MGTSLAAAENRHDAIERSCNWKRTESTKSPKLEPHLPPALPANFSPLPARAKYKRYAECPRMVSIHDLPAPGVGAASITALVDACSETDWSTMTSSPSQRCCSIDSRWFTKGSLVHMQDRLSSQSRTLTAKPGRGARKLSHALAILLQSSQWKGRRRIWARGIPAL